MKLSLYITVFVQFLIIFAVSAEVQLVGWDTAEGVKRHERSQHKVDFYRLSSQFETQSNKIFCGPTTASILLNSIRKEKLVDGKLKLPLDRGLLDKSSRKYLKANRDYVYNRYTQNNVFDVSYLPKPQGQVKSREDVLGKPIKSLDGKSDWGFQLRQLKELLVAHGLQVQLRVADDKLKEKKIRKEIIGNLKSSGDYVLVNYSRKALKQPGGGHMSPVAAYDKKSDSFLVLDVTPNKDSWVWVKAKDLIAAMKTFDTVENRGYLLVREGAL